MSNTEKIQSPQTKPSPRPPEEEFFDPEPDPGRQHKKNPSFSKWGIAAIVAVFGLAFLLIFFRENTAHSKPKKKMIRDKEKPEFVSPSAMDRAILNSRPKEENVPEAPANVHPVKKKERSLKSDIAVYVYKLKSEQNQYAAFERMKQKSLGIPSGTKIPALLEDRVFSFNVAAPVLAVVSKDFKWNEKTVIPKGSKFLGEANVLKSLDRINVSFDLLIFPDGTEKHVRALALADDGASGIRGKVDKHRDTKVLKAIGETLLGGASLFVGGTRNGPYSLEDQLRTNLAQNLTSQAAQDLRNVRVEESITVEASTPVEVMLLEAI